MFTEVLIIIGPEFLLELEKLSLTPVFLLFRVSCYHLFSQSLSLVVLVSSQSSPISPRHTHTLTHSLPLTSAPDPPPARPALRCWCKCLLLRAAPRTVPCSPGQRLPSHIFVSPLHCLRSLCPCLVCSACLSPSRAALALLLPSRREEGTHTCSGEQALDLKSWLARVFRRF